jgi:hypothetical protein
MDRRDQRQPHWLKHDHERMLILVEGEDEEGREVTTEIPARYDVCGTCDGRGTHVNPSIDRHGISAREFHEDPGFREDYFSGVYDVTCNECAGRRVVLVPVDESKILADRWQDEYDYAAERAAEMRMGC